MSTTRIRNASWVIAWDAEQNNHIFLRDTDVVFQDDRIVAIGGIPDGAAKAGTEIDGAGMLVMPGLVDVHCHPTTEPAFRGVREEHAVPEMYMSGLYERMQAYQLDPEGRAAAAELAYSELLRSGVTTLADLSAPFDGWVDLLGRSGLRAYAGPFFASARWVMEAQHKLGYAWDETAGKAGFETAQAIIKEAEGHSSGRLGGIVNPAQIDTCTEDLLRDAATYARETHRPVTTHASQSVIEFQEMLRRHGKTPLQWAAEIGFLGDKCLIGHAMFVDRHSTIRWHSDRDVGLLAETGTTVAHCPMTFARYGMALENFAKYKAAGVNLSIGTDCAPHNMLEEMRLAFIVSHLMAQDVRAGSVANVLHAATVGGARGLGRDDIGKLAPGAKADLVLVDLETPTMRPVRDPLRSLVFHGADRAVRHVYVDGKLALKDGKPVGLKPDAAAARLEEAQARMLETVPRRDYAGRDAATITPLSLPLG